MYHLVQAGRRRDLVQHGSSVGQTRVRPNTCRMRSKASSPIISAGGGSTLCARFEASSFSKNCSFVGVCAHDAEGQALRVASVWGQK